MTTATAQSNTRPPAFEQDSVRTLLDSCAPHQRALFGLLAAGDRHGFDVTPLIHGLADEQARLFCYRGNQLAKRMGEGEDVTDLVSQLPGLLPPSCVLAMKLAKQNGTLPGLYQSVLDIGGDCRAVNTDMGDNNWSRIIRLIGRVFIILVLFSFVLLKIVPELQLITEEFGTERTNGLDLLMLVGDRIAKFWFIPFFIFLLFIPMMFSGFVRYLKRWSPTKWRQSNHRPEVVRRNSVALATEGQQPMSTGLGAILKSHFLWKHRRGIKKAKGQIDSGNEQWGSLASANVISNKEAKALTLSGNSDSQAWMLRWSAKKRDKQKGRWITNLVTALIAFVNILIALLVFVTGYGVISTLIRFVEDLG